MARPPNPEAPRRLLDAARRTFARVGVDNARIQDIAADAGFSKAAFYLYYDSKEQVFEQLMQQLFDAVMTVANERHAAFRDLVHRLGPCSAADWRTGSERLAAFAALDHTYNRRILQVMWDQRDVFGCLLEQASGDRRAIVDRLVAVSTEMLAGRLKEAMDAGFLRGDLPSDLAADMIVGVWLQLARRMVRLEQPPDLDAWALAIDRFVAEGLGGRPNLPVAKESA